jgi:beta-lactamase class D
MKFTFLILLTLAINSFSQTEKEINSWKSFYGKYQVSGCILIYDLNNNEYLSYNTERCRESFSPASTFKILNSLIALETGVIMDENEVIPWDSVKRSYDKWNMDQTLRSAIKYSAVWAYQELARRIGEKRMQYFIDTVKYGNCNISGGIDQFWLNGALKISPVEQVEFLKRLYSDNLPFSKRNLNIVKDIIINEQTDNYILRGKTGWGSNSGTDIGWYVGYLSVNGNVYFFANNINIADEKDPAARIDIVKDIFRSMDLLK